MVQVMTLDVLQPEVVVNMEGGDDVVDLQARRVHVSSNEKRLHGHHAKPCFVDSTHGTDHSGFVGKWVSSDATPAWWFPFSYEQPEPLRTLQHLPHAHTPSRLPSSAQFTRYQYMLSEMPSTTHRRPTRA